MTGGLVSPLYWLGQPLSCTTGVRESAPRAPHRVSSQVAQVPNPHRTNPSLPKTPQRCTPSCSILLHQPLPPFRLSPLGLTATPPEGSRRARGQGPPPPRAGGRPFVSLWVGSRPREGRRHARGQGYHWRCPLPRRASLPFVFLLLSEPPPVAWAAWRRTARGESGAGGRKQRGAADAGGRVPDAADGNADERRGGCHLSSACPRFLILSRRDERRRGQPPLHTQGRMSRTSMGKEHPGLSFVPLASWWNGASHHYGLLLAGRRSPISIEGRREEGGS